MKHPLSHAKKCWNNQRWQSKGRNIPFLLTFDEWYHWWLVQGEDRNIPTRHSANKKCMCRFNDVGPYALNNIYCDTVSNNMKLANQLNPEYNEVETPLGVFKNAIQAAIAHNVHKVTMRKWIREGLPGFHRL